MPLWFILFGTLLIDKNIFHFWNAPFTFRLVDYVFFILLGLMISSSAILAFLLHGAKVGNNPTFITVKDAENDTSEFALYSITYIIPFLIKDYLEPSNAFALCVMIITIGFLYIRSNMFHINPTLSLFKYNLYKVSDSSNNKFILLSKRELQKDEKIKANRFNGLIYIEMDG
jgi:hypothetical protein